MTRLIAVLVVLGLAACGTAAAPVPAPTAPDAGVPVALPADAAPAPDAPVPTTWVERFYDASINPSDPEGPTWGWDVVAATGQPITADPGFGGFILATGPEHPRLAVSHPLVQRKTTAIQVNWRYPDSSDGGAIPIGPQVQVFTSGNATWQSGFMIQIGDSPGEAIWISGGANAGAGWADGSDFRPFPEGDYAPGAQGTAWIQVDAAGNAEASIAGLTLRHSGFHVGNQVVIGDLSDAAGADASVVISLVVQWEPPGGVVLP